VERKKERERESERGESVKALLCDKEISRVYIFTNVYVIRDDRIKKGGSGV